MENLNNLTLIVKNLFNTFVEKATISLVFHMALTSFKLITLSSMMMFAT